MSGESTIKALLSEILIYLSSHYSSCKQSTLLTPPNNTFFSLGDCPRRHAMYKDYSDEAGNGKSLSTGNNVGNEESYHEGKTHRPVKIWGLQILLLILNIFVLLRNWRGGNITYSNMIYCMLCPLLPVNLLIRSSSCKRSGRVSGDASRLECCFAIQRQSIRRVR